MSSFLFFILLDFFVGKAMTLNKQLFMRYSLFVALAVFRPL